MKHSVFETSVGSLNRWAPNSRSNIAHKALSLVVRSAER
jgi:hypothetical protein